eukprot:ANDGO_07831.mRNA.1 hypothetical protein
MESDSVRLARAHRERLQLEETKQQLENKHHVRQKKRLAVISTTTASCSSRSGQIPVTQTPDLASYLRSTMQQVQKEVQTQRVTTLRKPRAAVEKACESKLADSTVARHYSHALQHELESIALSSLATAQTSVHEWKSDGESRASNAVLEVQREKAAAAREVRKTREVNRERLEQVEAIHALSLRSLFPTSTNLLSTSRTCKSSSTMSSNHQRLVELAFSERQARRKAEEASVATLRSHVELLQHQLRQEATSL